MSSLLLTITDAAVVIIILISCLLSFFRGFQKEIFSLIAWSAALIFGIYGSNFLSPHFSNLETKISIIHWISGGLIGFIVLVLMTLFNHYLSKQFYFNYLNAINRSLGFLFGLARGFFLVSLAFLVIQSFISKNTNSAWIEKSKSRVLLQHGAGAIIYLIPKQINERLNEIGIIIDKPQGPLIFQNLNLPKIKPIAPNSTPGYTSDQRAIMHNTIKKLK
jgi:membrane protein required for colicin V production